MSWIVNYYGSRSKDLPGEYASKEEAEEAIDTNPRRFGHPVSAWSPVEFLDNSGRKDMVNHPPHYTAIPGLKVIDITENLNFCLGNAVKYILRADYKGDWETDIRKSIWYLNREIERRKREGNKAK